MNTMIFMNHWKGNFMKNVMKQTVELSVFYQTLWPINQKRKHNCLMSYRVD